MSRSLYENHWGSPTLTLLNVLGVLGVLNVLYVLHLLNVLHGRIVGLLGLVSKAFRHYNYVFIRESAQIYKILEHLTRKINISMNLKTYQIKLATLHCY